MLFIDAPLESASIARRMSAGALFLRGAIAASTQQRDRPVIRRSEFHRNTNSLTTVAGLKDAKVQVRAAGKPGVPRMCYQVAGVHRLADFDQAASLLQMAVVP